MKKCSGCHKNKASKSFNKNPRLSKGLNNICKKCCKERGKENYLKNKNSYKERAKKWAKNNLEKRREIVRKSDFKLRDKKNKKQNKNNKINRQINPDKARQIGRYFQMIRRCRNRNAKGFVSKEQIEQLLNKAKGYCVYCGKKTEKLTIDHFQPLSKGGSNYLNNLFPCCKTCNSSKHTKTAEDWLYKMHGKAGLFRALLFAEGKDFLKVAS